MALVESSREPAVLWQRDVPEALRAGDTLVRPDYVDVFTGRVAGGLNRSAKEWTLATLGSSPAPLRVLIPLVHRLVLGLRLGPALGPGYVLGWKIAAEQDDWLRLETSSWFLAAHLVIRVEPERLSVGTFLRYDHWLASLIWPPVSLLHRQVGLMLLRHALRGAAGT